MKKTRKTEYKPKWDCITERVLTDPQAKQLADEMLDWILSDNKNFWLNDFAAEKMFTPVQIRQIAQTNTYFASVFQICKVIQESKLLKMALYKEVNAAPAVFILKSVIGTGEDDKPADLESAKKQVEEIFE